MVTVKRIPENARSLRVNCACGDTAAYQMDGLAMCAPAAESAVPGTVPALPAGVRVVWSLDPVGEETARDDVPMPARYVITAGCETVYRILPGTLDAAHGWVMGGPLTAALDDDGMGIRRHGYTMAHVLMSIREIFEGHGWNGDAVKRARLVVVRNYGYSFILEG